MSIVNGPKRWALLWMTLLVIGTVLLAACQGDDGDTGDSGDSADAGDDELTEVNFGELQIAPKVPHYIAEEFGYYEEAGLDIETEYIAGGAEILPAMISGDLQAGHVNIASFVFALAEGVDLVCLTSSDSARTEPPDTLNLLVRSDSGIEDLEDLVGKTVAVNNLESLVWVFIAALLEDNGIDHTSVEFTELGFPQMNDPLVNGQVDAIAQIEPFTAVLLQNDDVEVLAPGYLDVLPGVDLGCQSALRDWVEDNPEAAAGIAEAYDRGKEDAAADDAETRQHIVDWVDLDESLADEIVLSGWYPGVDVELIQEFADLMHEFGMISEPVDFSEAVLEGSER